MEFEIFHEAFRKRHRNIVYDFSRRYGVDEHDVESELGESLIRAYEKVESLVDRMKLAYRILTQRVIDLRRKITRLNKFEVDNMVYEEERGVYVEVYEVAEVAPTTSGEIITIEDEIKKIDQRQLIDNLLKKASVETVQSVNAYLESSSSREAAKLLGTSHTTINRRIRSLAKAFDSRKFGDYRDYLSGPVHAI